ncbi:MAG: tyrosine-type recombinase/integrase, partial [Candidatus Eisenbacteria sp.]|nr:tyrosine-type recombinase/integrase [Candidatus Eisenbacteria bacterium]
MSALREASKKYLELRRNLGFQLRGVDSALRSFVTFAEREGVSYITTDLALRWAKEPPDAQPATWASRLRMVRRFAVWLSATDQCTEVPPVGLLPHRYRRQRPYIYSDAEIEKLVQAAGQLPSPLGLKGRTYSTIFGLLSVTGMRVSEALALDREDVNPEEGILKIRRTKFGKSRLVPIHESTCQVLMDYARER